MNENLLVGWLWLWQEILDIFHYGWRNLLEALVYLAVAVLSITVRQIEDWLQIAILIIAVIGGLYRLRLAYMQGKALRWPSNGPG